jgi:phosphohistidine phosphatase SixA
MAKAIAQAMGVAGEIPNAIFSSPFMRAIQTADIVGKILKAQVNVIGDLSPIRPIDETILGLMSHGEIKRVMIVGHKDNVGPAMNNFGSVDGDDWKDEVMAEVRRVRIDRDTGKWSLKWQLRPSDLGLRDVAQ